MGTAAMQPLIKTIPITDGTNIPFNLLGQI